MKLLAPGSWLLAKAGARYLAIRLAYASVGLGARS
jgi:hypothetical protein